VSQARDSCGSELGRQDRGSGQRGDDKNSDVGYVVLRACSEGESLSYLILKVDEGLAVYDAKRDGLDGQFACASKDVVGEDVLLRGLGNQDEGIK